MDNEKKSILLIRVCLVSCIILISVSYILRIIYCRPLADLEDALWLSIHMYPETGRAIVGTSAIAFLIYKAWGKR